MSKSKHKERGLNTLTNRGFGRKPEEASVAVVEESALPPLPIAPVFEDLITLPLVHIRPFEGNPRKHDNPEYPEIKESIAQVGVTQMLQVTKRPNEEFYVLRAGGNTRLKALNALLEEAVANGDQVGIAKYSNIPVMYYPYQSELSMLAMHVQENNLRGAMHFIDGATAVVEAIELVEGPRKTSMGSEYKPLSAVNLSAELVAQGFPITRQRIGFSVYAHSIRDVFPKAFADNMGRPMIENIRRDENVLREWIKLKGMEALEDDVISQYLTILKQFDQGEMTASKWEDIFIDAIVALGDAIGDKGILTEIGNVKEHKQLSSVSVSKEDDAVSEAKVDEPDSEVKDDSGNDDSESNSAEDSATVVQLDPAAKELEKDSATVVSVDALKNTMKDLIELNPVLSALIVGKDSAAVDGLVDSDAVMLIYEDLYLRLDVLHSVSEDNSLVRSAVSIAEFSQLITAISMMKDVFSLIIRAGVDHDMQAEGFAVFGWYLQNQESLFKHETFNNLLEAVEVLDSILSAVGEPKLDNLNTGVMTALYEEYFKVGGLDLEDFNEFVLEYLEVKAIVRGLYSSFKG